MSLITPLSVNEDAVKQLVQNLGQAVGGGRFNTADVLVALAEFTGRTVVQVADTPVAGFQVVGVVGDHVKRAMIAGYTAKGFSMGGESVQPH